MHDAEEQPDFTFSLKFPPPGDYERVELPMHWLPVSDESEDPALVVGYEIEGHDPGHEDGVLHPIDLPVRLLDFVQGRGSELVERLQGELGIWHAQTAGYACHQKYVVGIKLAMPDATMVGAMRLARSLLHSCIMSPPGLSDLMEYHGLLTQHLGVTIERPHAYQQLEEACYPIDAQEENLAGLLSISTEEAKLILEAALPDLPEKDADSELSRSQSLERFMTLSAMMHDRINIWIFGENCD